MQRHFAANRARVRCNDSPNEKRRVGARRIMRKDVENTPLTDLWWRRQEVDCAGVLQTNKLLKIKHAQNSQDARFALSTHVLHTRRFRFSM